MKKAKILISITCVVLLIVIIFLLTTKEDKYSATVDKYLIDVNSVKGSDLYVINSMTDEDYDGAEQAISECEKLYNETDDIEDLYTLCVVLNVMENSIDNKDIIIEYNNIFFDRLISESINISKTNIEYLHWCNIQLLWKLGDKDKAIILLRDTRYFASNETQIEHVYIFISNYELDDIENDFLYKYLVVLMDEEYDELSLNHKMILIDSMLLVLDSESDVDIRFSIIDLFGDLYVEKMMEKTYSIVGGTNLYTRGIYEVYKDYDPNNHDYDEIYAYFERKYMESKTFRNLENLCWVLIYNDNENEYNKESIRYYQEYFEQIIDSDIKFEDYKVIYDFYVNYLKALYFDNEMELFEDVLMSYKKYDFPEYIIDSIFNFIYYNIINVDETIIEHRELIYNWIESHEGNETIEKREFLGWYALRLKLDEKAIELFVQNRNKIVEDYKKKYSN